MTTTNDTGFLTLPAVQALAEGQRVKITASGWDLCGIAEASAGVATHAVAAGGMLTAKLWSAPGSWIVKASAAIAAGARLYPANGGLFAATGTTPFNLVAKDAATAANDLIEALPCQVGA
ncbi:MAG TPA: hypothetical protein VNO52_00350 [Methylomirabilota bacterium]|nr:hypothetical protein [Methylomirabilota bacterium]